MNARDDLNRASDRASAAREDLGRAGDDLERAGEHAGEAASHAKEAMKAGASGTLDRAREVTRETGRKAGRAAERAADTARETGKKAGHVAESMRQAQPDRELESRVDSTAETVLRKTGEGLQGAAPTIGKGVEKTASLSGSAMHAAAGPLGAVVGKIAGKVGGWWKSASEQTVDFAEEEQQLCLQHFDAYPTKPAGLTFDTARTAYQIGYLAAEHPEYGGRDFDEIETELRHGFVDEPTEEYHTLRDFARFGYERAMLIQLPEDEDRVTVR